MADVRHVADTVLAVRTARDGREDLERSLALFGHRRGPHC
jgi:hypothetical protein